MNGCPHSNRFDANPLTCTLCIGATARAVTIDPETRQLSVDGVTQERRTDHEAVTNAPPNKGSRARNNGRRQKTCGQCGRTGHNRAKCHGQAASTSGTEAMILADNEEAA